MGRKLGGCAPLGEEAGSPSNTIWLGPRPTGMPSFILIRATVWPQCTNVTDRQTDRQTGQTGQTGQDRTGQTKVYSIGRTALQTLAQKSQSWRRQCEITATV